MRAALRLGLASALLVTGAWRVQAEEPAKPDRFAPIRFFAGEWRGTASGEAGEGAVERSYQFVLAGRFLHERNVTTYPAQGEVHEHQSFFSYDRARERIVLRQFHEEGFVNTYVLDPAVSSQAKLVFVSESFENLDAGWQARETYDVISADEFVETFELAAPGKAFEVYSRSHFTRRGPAGSGPTGARHSRIPSISRATASASSMPSTPADMIPPA